MPNVGVICFLASYGLALAAELSRLAWRNRVSHWVMLGLTAAGLVAHTLYLLIRSRVTNLPPLLSSLHDWLLVLAWIAVLVYLFVTLLDRDLAIGLIVLPLVVVLVIASYFVPWSGGTAQNAPHNWTMLHVSLLVLGIAGVFSGLVSGLMYLWQHYRLKHRQALQPGLTLPSLERLERFNRLAILVSVPLLTFGMVLGVGLAMVKFRDESVAERILRDPLILGSGVCWLFMTGVFAWLLSKRDEPGRKVAWLTVWSCGFLLLTTIATQVLSSVTKGVHSSQPTVSRDAEGFRSGASFPGMRSRSAAQSFRVAANRISPTPMNA